MKTRAGTAVKESSKRKISSKRNIQVVASSSSSKVIDSPLDEIKSTLKAAIAKGMRSFSIFGLKVPLSSSTVRKGFSLSKVDDAINLLQFLNDEKFVSIGIVDCELSPQCLLFFQPFNTVMNRFPVLPFTFI